MNDLDYNERIVLDYLRRHRKMWHSYTDLRIGLAAMDDDNLNAALAYLRGYGFIRSRVNGEAARGWFWEYCIGKRRINKDEQHD